jgi:hypothetical protein
MSSHECVEHCGYHCWHHSKQHEEGMKLIIIGSTLRTRREGF